MGASQSKQRRKGRHKLEQDAIVAAAVASTNKMQRRLIQRQVEEQQLSRQRSTQQLCCATSCQELYNPSPVADQLYYQHQSTQFLNYPIYLPDGAAGYQPQERQLYATRGELRQRQRQLRLPTTTRRKRRPLRANGYIDNHAHISPLPSPHNYNYLDPHDFGGQAQRQQSVATEELLYSNTNTTNEEDEFGEQQSAMSDLVIGDNIIGNNFIGKTSAPKTTTATTLMAGRKVSALQAAGREPLRQARLVMPQQPPTHLSRRLQANGGSGGASVGSRVKESDLGGKEGATGTPMQHEHHCQPQPQQQQQQQPGHYGLAREPRTAILSSQQSTSSQYSSQGSRSTSSPISNSYNNHNHTPVTIDEPARRSGQLQRKHHYNRNNDNLITTTLSGQPPMSPLVIQSSKQRGLAFSEEQRRKNGLSGLLPAAYQDQDLQVRAVMNFIDNCKDELSKYIYLRNLKDFNERLFYYALTQNVEKLMPLVYTPTVGLACQRFSEIYLRPRGLFITINDSGRVASLLANWPERDVRVIVVTDGERILGLGDLGANGMGISIGKLSLYTALAGIPPQNVLPITIDVGTNNETFLKDPFYIGLRQKRVRGEKFDNLMEEFMEAVVERWGRSCLIQFEDFANSTAFELLQRYRNRYCTFNDDIQGTASVCLSGLISATKLILNKRLSDSSFLFYGAGEANLGTANLLTMAMVDEGVSADEAKSRVWLVDSKGLVTSSRQDLSSHKRAFAQEAPEIIKLDQIIEHIKPTAMIGASAQTGAFNESICKKMAEYNKRPIIFALSNPTSRAECTAQQAYTWTKGQCVFASGSPFEPVEYEGNTYVTGQGNNAYIFPGVGLAAIAAHLHTIPEETFLIAARALSDELGEQDTKIGLVYPSLSKIRQVTLKVATRVLEYFYAERLATYRPEPSDKPNFLRGLQYDGRYSENDEQLEPLVSKVSLSNGN